MRRMLSMVLYVRHIKKGGAEVPPASIDLAMRLLSGEGLHEGRRGALVVLRREGVG